MKRFVYPVSAAITAACMITASADDVLLLDYRRPVNTITVSGNPLGIEYSNVGTKWYEIPFAQSGSECYFESVNARMLRVRGDADISSAAYIIGGPDTESDGFLRKYKIIERIYDISGNASGMAELDGARDAVLTMKDDKRYSRYDIIKAEQELEKYMDSIISGSDGQMRQLFGEARDGILKNINAGFVYNSSTDADIRRYISTMLTPSSQSGALWQDITGMSVSSASLTSVYKRINTMAMAYQCDKSAYYKSRVLLDSILRALELADRLWYNSGTEMYGNWWDFIIGVPQNYCKTLAVVWDELQESERERYGAALEHFCRYGAYSGTTPSGQPQAGANLVNISNYDYIMGVLTGDAQKIQKALDMFGFVFDYEPDYSGNDGFYADGSFLQHGVPYNGNYGREFLTGVVDMAELLNGTVWEFTDSMSSRVCEWIDCGYLPLVFRASMMDMVNGRAIVRGNTDKNYGYETGRAILHYAAILKDKTKGHAYIETVKYWFLNSSESGGITWRTNCDDYSRALIESDEYEAVDHTPEGVYIYPNMDRVVYRPSGAWAAGLAMYSSRIPTYELVNGENKKGWYTGSGALYIYSGECDTRYSSDYWLAADMYSVPGTTTDSTKRYYDGEGAHYQNGDAEGKSSSGFAGGVSLDGCGAAAMELSQVNTGTASDLMANKSYFMFPDGVMCIGTGIRGGNGEVYTTVDNICVGENEYSLYADGEPQTADGTVINGKSLAIGGSCGNTGWYFPEGGDIELEYEVRTASPSEVRHDSALADVTKGFLTVKLQHKTEPKNASYAYMVLPGKSKSELDAYVSAPHVRILSKTDKVHAVYDSGAKITGMVFFAKGTAAAGNGAEISCGSPALVMMSDNGDISAADPTGTLSNLKITINRDIRYADNPLVSVNNYGTRTVLDINMTGLCGKTVTINKKGL